MQIRGHTEQEGGRRHLFRGPAGVPCGTQYEMKGASGGCNLPYSQPCSVNKVKQIPKCFIVFERGKQIIQLSFITVTAHSFHHSQSEAGLFSLILTLTRHERNVPNCFSWFGS